MLKFTLLKNVFRINLPYFFFLSAFLSLQSSLVKLSDRMMKSLLQSNLIFLQQNETKLRRARLNRGARDLRKMTLLRVVSRRIRGYVDVLKDSCCWERIIDSASDHTTNTTTEFNSPMAPDSFRDDEPAPYRDCRLQDTTNNFRSDETNSEPLLSKHPKEKLLIGQGVIEKSVRVMLDGSASQLKRLRTEWRTLTTINMPPRSWDHFIHIYFYGPREYGFIVGLSRWKYEKSKFLDD